MKLGLTGRIILTVLCFGLALVGFMVKLPSPFRHHDTELHTLFYFLAAGFLNVLFVKRNLAGHVLVFIVLYGMGVGIEYAQEYSNTLVGERIHGRYDPEDIAANLKGLIYFSVGWVVYVILWYASTSKRSRLSGTETQVSNAAIDTTRDGAPRHNQRDTHHSLDRDDERILQIPAFPHNSIDLQHEKKLNTAMQLLTEVMKSNPGHPLAAELEVIITQLKKTIQATRL